MKTGGSLIAAFRPFGPRYLVREVSVEEKSAGGILLVTGENPKVRYGFIVGVGTGIRNQHTGEFQGMPFTIGDCIIFRETFEVMQIRGKKYALVNENDVLGEQAELDEEDEDNVSIPREVDTNGSADGDA
jgi:chaperonin GroES